MSDDVMHLLATDPLAMPGPDRRVWAEAVVRELCGNADQIIVHAEDEPSFYCAMENHEATCCPYCTAGLDK
jgi:hypothetical protein